MAENPNQYQRMSAASPAANPAQAAVAQLPVQEQAATPRINPRDKYKNILFGFGVTEIIFGVISVVFGVVTIIIAAANPQYYYSGNYIRYYHHGFTYIGQGIWCGAFLIVTGVFAVKTKSNSSVCMYNANLGLSIVTANIMVPYMVFSVIAAILETDHPRYYQLRSLITLHGLLAILAFVASIVCIVHSAYCCAGICCQKKPHRGQVTYVAQPQQMVRLADGRYVMVSPQPVGQFGYPAAATAPMAPGQIMYQPPQGGLVAPQMMVPPQAQFMHPTTAYPPSGQQQPVYYPGAAPAYGQQQPVYQGSAPPPQAPGGSSYPHPTAPPQQMTGMTKDQTQEPGVPPSYPH